MANFSIIIPTHNRDYYLKRVLSYYNGFEGGYNIIVADSSSDEIKKRNKKIVSLFPNLNILYLSNYPFEINPYHKTTDALNYVNTKYCVFCADDDFITPNGISQSVDFLEKNPDFTVAHGHYISFCLKLDERGKQQFHWGSLYSHESNTSSDPVSRLIEHFNYSQTTYYAVHRTIFLKMIFKETTKFTNDVYFVYFGELLLSMLTLIYGKMKDLDVFYSARDGGASQIGYSYVSFKELLGTGIFTEKYAKFRDCLATHLSKNSWLDVEKSKKIVDCGWAGYMERYYALKISFFYRTIHKMKAILDYLGLPDWVEKRLRPKRLLFPKAFDGEKIPMDDSSSKYYDDFNKIRLHVLNYKYDYDR